MFRKAKIRTRKRNTADGDNHLRRGKNFSKPLKRRIFLIAVIFSAAVMVPIIFATAADSNQVAQVAEIPVLAKQSVQPLSTQTAQPLPTTTDGQLTSDLTETTILAPAEATPTPTSLQEPVPSAEPTPVSQPESVYSSIAPGQDDPFVAIIQQRLMDLKYMEQDETTTLFGPITSQAIEYFQRKNGLNVDGIAGAETQTILFSDSAKVYTVSEGASGPDVESIQERLADLGYNVEKTGYFGSDTAKAVGYFQRMNGLTDDGNVGSDTREMLYSSEAEPALESDKKPASSDSKQSSSNTSDSTSDKKSDNKSDNTSDKKSDNSSKQDSKPVLAPNPGNAEAFVKAALAQLGKPYVWGGKGPNSFDCSGFVYYALKISGNGIGYMTSAGWHNSGYTKITRMQDLKRGDVIDYKGHVGIYLGDGTMVDASSSEGKIRISSNIFNSSYWTSNFLEGRRLF